MSERKVRQMVLHYDEQSGHDFEVEVVMSEQYLFRRIKTVFGMQINIDSKITSELMLVCTNNGGGWKPRKVILPHQLYTKSIDEWRKEDQSITEVACFPLKSNSYVTVWNLHSAPPKGSDSL